MADLLRLGKIELPLGDATYVMGVINLSPDSKNTHTIARSVDEALLMADRYRQWGATLVDVGGQSSHFENETIATADEVSLVVPTIEALAAEGHLVSIDTWKPEVAEAAVAAGAVMINDTGGLADPGMRQVVASTRVAAIAVYIEGDNPHDVAEIEISDAKAAATARGLAGLLGALEQSGITNVIVDPGIALNYPGDYEEYQRMQLEVIMQSGHLRRLGRPLLIPIPRKRDAHRVAAFISLALEHDADIIRVHDVAMACDLARLFRRCP